MTFAIYTPLLLILSCLLGFSSSIQLWSSPGALPTTIPASCRAELSKNITCSPVLISPQFVAGGRALDPKAAAQYCTPSCYNSLKVRKICLYSRPFSLKFKDLQDERRPTMRQHIVPDVSEQHPLAVWRFSR